MPSHRQPVLSKLQSILVLLLILLMNLGVWAWLNSTHPSPSWDGTIMGLSFNPNHTEHSPEDGYQPPEESIRADLEKLQGVAHAVRTYSVTNGLEMIPALADQVGLNVSIGAWIGQHTGGNEQEITNLIKLSNSRLNNIVRVLVGNEAILRADVTVDEMLTLIKQVKDQVWRPVSTAEPWHVWLQNPELVEAVDFIGVHILPYWEGIPADQAVDYVLMRYRELKDAYPNKPVVIMEVGWPSDGATRQGAKPSLANQANFLRAFLNIARAESMTYYIVEAFDQPWKRALEGTVGAYWGIYDAQGEPKFPMQGEVDNLPDWQQWAVLAIILALLPALVFLDYRGSVRLPGKLFFLTIVNIAAFAAAWTISIGLTQYQSTLTASVWVFLVLLQAFALLIFMMEAMDVSEILWQNKSERDFTPIEPIPFYKHPKVSIHVPIHNEPPDMVIETLKALNTLDYANYEVLIIDNNTPDESVWKPVEDFCAELGERFRFFHLDNWRGYKAGALNYALGQAAEDTDIIAVIDSDYQVERDWLRRMVPHFMSKNVGFVQAPQDYRDGNESLFKAMCYWEYAGFFHIGMVQRNQANAIIQHGTMTMIRKSALLEAGLWGEWCICEDADLGLRLYEKGYDSVYVNHSFGQGLMPDTLSAYKTQRYRWVYGAMQIMKQHWRQLFFNREQALTRAQRYYFTSGWLPWIADGLSLVLIVASVMLSISALFNPSAAEFPVTALLLPVIGLFLFKLIRSVWLYAVKVRCGFWQTMGSALAGLSLSYTVGRAVWAGLFTNTMPFVRTPKMVSGKLLRSAFSMIKDELFVAVLLLSLAWLIWRQETISDSNAQLWAIILVVQSLPCFAAVLTAVINVHSNWKVNRAVASTSSPLEKKSKAKLKPSKKTRIPKQEADAIHS